MPRMMLFLTLFLLGAAAARAQGLAFVIDSAGAAVSVVDVGSEREIRRIPVLREPHHMALTPDHRFLLIGDTTGNELLFLDPRSGEILRRLTVSDPYQLQFSPDGKWLVVNGLARNQVDIFDAKDYHLVHRVALKSMPSHLNFSPDSSTVYITLQGTDRLAAIALGSGAVLWDTEVGETPAAVLWHNGQLLVAVMGGNGISVVDPATGLVRARIPTGRGAHNLFLSPDGKVIYVTNRIDGTLAVLDAQSLKVMREIRVSGGPDDLDFGPDGRLWISRRFAHSVAVLDPVSGHYDVIEVGRSPHGIWLNTHDHLPRALAGTAPPHS